MCRIPLGCAGFPRDLQDSSGTCRIPQEPAGILWDVQIPREAPSAAFPGAGMDVWELCQQRLGCPPCSDGNEQWDPALLPCSSSGCPRHREVTNLGCQGAAPGSKRSQSQPWAVLGSAGRAARACQALGMGRSQRRSPSGSWAPIQGSCPGQGQPRGNARLFLARPCSGHSIPAWSQGCAPSSPGWVSLDAAELQERGDKGQQCLGSRGHLALQGARGASTAWAKSLPWHRGLAPKEQRRGCCIAAHMVPPLGAESRGDSRP